MNLASVKADVHQKKECPISQKNHDLDKSFQIQTTSG